MFLKNNFLLFLVLVFAASIATAKDALPETSHDGLKLMHDTKLRAVYMKPGADLSQYDKVALLKAYVAFKKNWKRDYNEDTASLEGRINDHDMKQIRERVATEFNKEFTKVLTAGGHAIVTEAGTGVLIVRPAIINLDVIAPDKMTAGMSTTVAAGAGSMTLYMELFDGKTNSIIARVIDPEAASNFGMAQIQNRVTNIADADRLLKKWATILNDHLAAVKK
jgi:hypothetical protein